MVHGTSRSAFVVLAEGNEAHIQVSQPSDCLALERQHVCCHTLYHLDVWLGARYVTTINGSAKQQPIDTWKVVFHHLLNTYRPTWCYIHALDLLDKIDDGFKVKLHDDTLYVALWNESRSVLRFRL